MSQQKHDDKTIIEALERVDRGEISLRKVAAELGYGHHNKLIERRKTLIKRGLWNVSNDKNRVVPELYYVKRRSQLLDQEGNVKLEWLISEQDADQKKELLQQALEAMAQDLPKVKPQTKPDYTDSDLMAIYPLGDPHIGMMAWGEESGQDWDLKIAEEYFCGVFDKLVKRAPKCAESVIVNLGDFFHADNLEAVTTRSGHHLDVDGRFAKMIRVGVKIMRQMIESALAHHGKIRVINATGNHDDTSAMFLSVCLANIYENEPRVIIDTSPAPFHYFTWGNSLFGVHHGHSCKSDRLPGVMAADQPKLWGDADYRYWLTGHIHHDTLKEYAGVVVESFRTLAAKDAYAAWGGYRAGQDSKALIVSKDGGIVERYIVNIKALK